MKSIEDIFHPELNDIFENTKKPRDGRLPLSRKMAEFMLGESLNNVVMYDLIQGQINRRWYNDSPVIGGQGIKIRIQRFQDVCRQSSVLAGRVPVAIVAKTYLDNRTMDYNKRGNKVAGNVIFYDAATKQYSAFTRGWKPCFEHRCDIAAAEQALYDAVWHMTNCFSAVEPFIRQK